MELLNFQLKSISNELSAVFILMELEIYELDKKGGDGLTGAELNSEIQGRFSNSKDGEEIKYPASLLYHKLKEMRNAELIFRDDDKNTYRISESGRKELLKSMTRLNDVLLDMNEFLKLARGKL